MERSSSGAPLVGVVIAAYQAEVFIEATLDSVLGQTYHDWFCLVVDDGSTDSTATLVRAAAMKDSRLGLIQQQNAGVSAARNAGFRCLPAHSCYVCFLDSDDLLLPDALEQLVDALAPRIDAVGVSGWAESIDVHGEPIWPGHHRDQQRSRRIYKGLTTRVLGYQEDSTFESLILNGAIWPPATALLRSSVFQRIGGFDEALVSQEDWDLFLRASYDGPFVFVDRQVAWYRRHPQNATNNNVAYLSCLGLVRRKAWRDESLTRARRALVLRTYMRYHAWMIKRQLELVPKEVRPVKLGALLAGVGWMSYGCARLIQLRPSRPSVKVLRLLVYLESRFRADRDESTFL